jgi:glycosyltransferase involved in cell wall biosynthesis
MKIAFICTEKLPSPAIRGGAIQMMIDGVLPYLKKHHDITVFSVSDPELKQQENIDGVSYIRFPREQYREHVAEELKQHHFDVVHVFNRPKNVPLYKQSAPDSHFVLSLHNEMFSENKISLEEGKEAINCVSAITVVSQYIKNTILERFPEAEEKIRIVYSGVDLESYPPVWTKRGQEIRERYRKKYGIQHNKVIVFIGRLSPTKGPHLLIQAMEEIIEKHPDAVLVIVGGKWFSDNRPNRYVRYLYKLAQPLKDHILFTKFIPAEEIPNMFLMGDVFVCSSQWNEPLARVHYEAMAAGIPLITTNRGGNSEVIRPHYNGLLLKNYDKPSAFSMAIDYIFREQEFSQWMAKNGRTFIELNFDFRHVAERLENVYLHVFQNV